MRLPYHNPNRITNTACRDPLRLWLHTSVRPLGRRQHLGKFVVDYATRGGQARLNFDETSFVHSRFDKNSPGVTVLAPAPKDIAAQIGPHSRLTRILMSKLSVARRTSRPSN